MSRRIFLYCHYDSRGGTTGVLSETREAADARYLAYFGVEEEDRAHAQTTLVDADFLGCCTIDGPLPSLPGAEEQDLCGGGEDLEWGLGGAVFLMKQDDEDEAIVIQGCLPDKMGGCELLYVPAEQVVKDAEGEPIPPPGFLHPRWDDDAVSFVLLQV